MALQLAQRLQIINYYSGIEMKSVLEDVDGLGEAYDNNEFNALDFTSTIGNMYRSQQVKIMLETIEQQLLNKEQFFRIPPETKLSHNGRLIEAVLATIKSKEDVMTGMTAFLNYMPEEWKNAKFSLSDKNLDIFEELVYDSLVIYADNIAN